MLRGISGAQVACNVLDVINAQPDEALATQVDLVQSRLQSLMDLGLTDKAVTDMLSRMPTLLGYQSEQLQAMQEYLGGHGGLSRVDVASLLEKDPGILSYSVAGVLSALHRALLCMCRQRSPACV